MTEYCKKCKKLTEDDYNDFMVAFCNECHTRRPHKSELQPFKCLVCGSMQDERYSNQVVCDDCIKQGDIPF